MNSAVGIHVLTGSGRLVAHAGRIRAQLRAASTAPIEQLALDGGSVDFVVRDDPRMVIPEARWAGYSLGFALIGDYLERHPGSSAAALATVPSETFRRS